jgi:hypothetical protein
MYTSNRRDGNHTKRGPSFLHTASVVAALHKGGCCHKIPVDIEKQKVRKEVLISLIPRHCVLVNSFKYTLYSPVLCAERHITEAGKKRRGNEQNKGNKC